MELTINADEIAAALRAHVGSFTPTLKKGTVGVVLEVGDGISPGLHDLALADRKQGIHRILADDRRQRAGVGTDDIAFGDCGAADLALDRR